MAIEIEKKFILTSEEESRLIADSEFVKEKEITDAYYDKASYDMVRTDRWLRQRNGSFELKIPLSSGGLSREGVNMYHELETEPEIRDALGLPTGTGDLAADLERAGYHIFVQAMSHRKTYRKDGFTIDIDSVTYTDSDFSYTLAEVELLINDESGAADASRQIMDYALSHDITTEREVDGKILAYMKHELPEHYAAFLSSR